MLKKLSPARTRHTILACIFSCLAVFYSFAPDHNADYQLKAAFIYKFTQYFEWEDHSNDLIVGVLGNSPIYEQLTHVAASKSGSDKRITVRQFQSLGDMTPCHILFIPRKFGAPIEEILAKVPRGTLTVTERPGCAVHGAAINFIVVDNKLKFEANLKAINAAGIKASSQLLKLAIIVG
jgi:hypothetical protein